MRITPNAQQLPINIVGSSTFGYLPKISAEKTYNMFESDGWLINMPGWRRVLEAFPTGTGRGAFVSVRGGFTILIFNSIVYRMDSVLGLIQIGILATSQGEVSIDENLNSQICICDGVNLYIYNWTLPPNLTIQTGAPLGAALIPNYVSFHDTFFLVGNGNKTSDGALWYAYQFDTATTVVTNNLLTFALQTKPDYASVVVRIPSQSSNVLVLGNTVSEVFTNVGGIRTYERNRSYNVDYGLVSSSTIASSDKYVAWLGSNTSNQPVIMVFTGQGAERISTDGIDYQLQQIKFPERSTAMMYTQQGHLFYQLTFYDPEDNLTLIYDFNTKKFYHGSDYKLDYHPARDVFIFNKKSYFISLNNASLYEMSPNFYNINENTPSNEFPDDPRIVFEPQRLRICSSIRLPDSAPFRINELVLTIRQGNDNILTNDCDIWMITEQGIRIFSEDNKQVIPENGRPDDCFEEYYRGRVDLTYSRDGGETYSNTVSRYMNPLAHRQNIMRWEKGGSGNDVIPKFRFWSLGSILVNNGLVSVTQ